MQIFSFSPFGYEGSLVTVEVDLRRGIPAVDIVGLADNAIKESRERMRCAIKNSNFEFPLERVLISLSPADLKKEGAGFDLAIALAVLQEDEKLKNSSKADFSLMQEDVLVMGELELSGKLRGVRGVHGAVSTAVSSGIMYCIVPEENAMEAREVSGIKVFAAKDLEEAFNAIHNKNLFTSRKNNYSNEEIPEGFELVDDVLFAKKDTAFDFSIVKHQNELIRSLEIAACGGHNIMAFGPPGCGKTLCLQQFVELVPALTVEESYTVTRIHSIAGILGNNGELIRKAPFRMPHQTASIEGICGGGVSCRPGEISLAHNGVLFLDEAAEFRTSVLQMLRVPLESKSITLSRAGRTTCYPANFQLLLATNPCPCGNYGSRSKICLCSARSVENYWNKFSGPLLDRIDLRVKVESRDDVESEETRCSNEQLARVDCIETQLRESVESSCCVGEVACASSESRASSDSTPTNDFPAYSTAILRQHIATGYKNARARQGKKNAHLSTEEIGKYCILENDAKEYLERESEKHDFSARAVASCLKVSRTISDIANEKNISLKSIKEAVKFRTLEGGLVGI